MKPLEKDYLEPIGLWDIFNLPAGALAHFAQGPNEEEDFDEADID